MSTAGVDSELRMKRITEGLPTKSEKMRCLAAAGFKRAEIARYLGVRYQFVYNVLSAPVPKSGRARQSVQPKSALSPSEGSNEPRTAMTEQPAGWIWTRVGKNGAIELPEAFQTALAIREGDHVQLKLEDDAIQILTREAALRALTNDVRRYIPEGVSLVDALIADRRAEVVREASGD